jgi:hypothetical protein
MRVYSFPQQCGHEPVRIDLRVSLSTVNSVDMRVCHFTFHHQQCGRQGVSQSNIYSQQYGHRGVFISTTSSIEVRDCPFPLHARCVHVHCAGCASTSRVYSFLLSVVWICMVYPFTVPAVWTCRVCPSPPQAL